MIPFVLRATSTFAVGVMLIFLCNKGSFGQVHLFCDFLQDVITQFLDLTENKLVI